MSAAFEEKIPDPNCGFGSCKISLVLASLNIAVENMGTCQSSSPQCMLEVNDPFDFIREWFDMQMYEVKLYSRFA